MAWNPFYNNNQMSEEKTSKYNAAIKELDRLDKLWIKCNLYSTRGDLFNWNWSLDAIWRELSGVKGGLEKNWIDQYKQHNKNIAKNRNNKSKCYQVLQDKHIFLKTLENHQGKGSAYKDDEDADGM